MSETENEFEQSAEQSAEQSGGDAAPAGPAPTPPATTSGATVIPFGRRSLLTMAAAAFVIVLAAAAGGAAVGHELWSGTATTVSFGAGSGPNGAGPGFFGGSASGGFVPGSSGEGSAGQGSFGQGSAASGGQGSFGSSGAFVNGGSATASSANVASVAAKVNGALVDIDSTLGYQSAAGAGTGIVLSSNGLVLTNNHVISGSTKLTATDVGNGKTYAATVVGYDPSHDVALLQLQGASGLQTAKLGDSAKAAVGQAVVGIGNAGGEGGTPASAGGSITGLNASITAGDELAGTTERLSGLIEVDAAIQSGDSGGPLVDTKGEVLGMNTAGSGGFAFSSSGTSAYAIPINVAISIARQLEADHPSATAHVGATAFLGVELSGAGAGGGGLGGFGGSSSGSSTGVTIADVVSGKPAAQAGLATGDTITSLSGKSITSRTDVSSLLLAQHPGDKLQIGWTDSSGQPHTSTVKLAAGPPA
jgi:S1-C subfamily serine protease